MKIGGQSVNDLGAPSLSALAIQNLAPDFMIEANLLLIGGEEHPLPGASDPLLEAGKPAGVVGGKNGGVFSWEDYPWN